MAAQNEPVLIESTNSRDISLSTISTTLSRPSSEQGDPTLTSPSAGETSNYLPQAEPCPPLQDQVIIPAAQVVPGTSRNPIDIVDDSPPRTPQAETKQQRMVEPHMLQNRHQQPHSYEHAWPLLAPKSVNGSTFTGQRIHEAHRMRTAKMTQPVWYPSRAHGFQQGLPIDIMYPLSAKYVAFAQTAAFSQPVIHYAPCPPSYLVQKPASTPNPPPTEEQLRAEAVQYVRQYSRSSPRKRRATGDPDETSESEMQGIKDSDALSSRSSNTKQIVKSAVEPTSAILPDPHFQLTPLVEHASLLTSLLRVYPESTEQTGLREDIALLASVQNQHLIDWLNFERGQSRKQGNTSTSRVSNITANSRARTLAAHVKEQGKAETETRRRHDDEIRCLLSANAKLWQDGSGLGVADVYGESRGSTPAASHHMNYERKGPAAVSVSLPVRCTGEELGLSPEQDTTVAPPAIKGTSTEVLRVEFQAPTPAVKTDVRMK